MFVHVIIIHHVVQVAVYFTNENYSLNGIM